MCANQPGAIGTHRNSQGNDVLVRVPMSSYGYMVVPMRTRGSFRWAPVRCRGLHDNSDGLPIFHI